MTKDEVGRVLQNIARLLELKGENPFKIRAYVNAARALEGMGEDLGKLIVEDRLRRLKASARLSPKRLQLSRKQGNSTTTTTCATPSRQTSLSSSRLQGLGARKDQGALRKFGNQLDYQTGARLQGGQNCAASGFWVPSQPRTFWPRSINMERSVGAFSPWRRDGSRRTSH